MRRSKLEEKIRIVLDRFIDSDYFQVAVRKLRSDHGIPQVGLARKGDRDQAFKQILFHPPKELKGGREAFREIRKNIHLITEKVLLQFLELDGLLLYYLFYNERYYSQLESLLSVALVRAVDIHRDAQEYVSVPETYWSLRGESVPIRPIALEIHPQASQRDILEYIKRHWLDIEAMQASYLHNGVQFHKTRMRKKSTNKRDQIIWENRRLPIKNIKKLLAERGEDSSLDARHITRLIALEKERRKQLK